MIRNTQTNKEYVGCTTILKHRLREHKNNLKNGRHQNPNLQRDCEKYGSEAFEFILLQEYPCDVSREALEQEETRVIQEKLEKGISLYNVKKT